MKIAIISDIHDNEHNLVKFFEDISEKNIHKIIFLGDFMNNGIAKLLANCTTPVHAIWGNNDGDKVNILKTAMREGSNLTIGFNTFDFLEMENKKIFLTHYPSLAQPMARSGDFDAIFYGHDHLQNIDTINNCLLVNPGEISAHKTQTASYAIYDTQNNSAEIFFLKDIITVKSNLSQKYRDNLSYDFSRSHKNTY